VEGSPATRWPAPARSSVKSSPLRLRLASPHSTSGRSIRSLVTSRRSSTPSGTVPGDKAGAAAAIAIVRSRAPPSKPSDACLQGGGSLSPARVLGRKERPPPLKRGSREEERRGPADIAGGRDRGRHAVRGRGRGRD
jgi:hypothetical protein